MAKPEKPKALKQIPTWLNFVIGGGSGMLAICIVQPMDLLKTRMQLSGADGKKAGLVQTASGILKNEGFTGFYNGLTAALFRQATYTTGRLGCFNGLFDLYKNSYGVPNFPAKVGMGMIAGGIGAFIGTPAEVSLIRMTADGRLPPEKRRNYTHVFNALARITREEGITTLWRGASATVSRAIVVNGAQLGSYTQARQMLLPFMYEGVPLHFAASMIAGFVTSVASLPVDIVKTRVQNAAKGASQIGVLMSVIKNEGILALWSGLLPTYAKIGPHTVFCFIFMEQFNALYRSILIATAIVQPMDLLKTRMQLLGADGKSTGLIETTSSILKNEGFTGFYRGLTAALFKQAVYTCGRMGCYSQFLEIYKSDYNDNNEPTFYEKVAIGMLAGGIGAFISTPAEVALIRTTADGRLPLSQKRNYRNVFSTLARIVREEGLSTCWRGATTTVTRAVVVNGVQLGTYVEAREYLHQHITNGVKLYFAASLLAGFVATIALLPIDIVKTRVQNSFVPQSQLKILMAIIKNEGVLALWSGLIPTYCKAAPSTILVYLLMEQLHAIYTTQNNTTTK